MKTPTPDQVRYLNRLKLAAGRLRVRLHHLPLRFRVGCTMHGPVMVVIVAEAGPVVFSANLHEFITNESHPMPVAVTQDADYDRRNRPSLRRSIKLAAWRWWNRRTLRELKDAAAVKLYFEPSPVRDDDTVMALDADCLMAMTG